MAGRRQLARIRQREAGAVARNQRGDCRPSGKGSGLHAVPGSRAIPCGIPRIGVWTAGARASRPDGSEEAAVPGAPVSGRRTRSILRLVAEGRRDRPESDRRIARDSLRSMVESRRGGSGHGPRLPYRPDEECPRAEVRVPGYLGGENRRAD